MTRLDASDTSVTPVLAHIPKGNSPRKSLHPASTLALISSISVHPSPSQSSAPRQNTCIELFRSLVVNWPLFHLFFIYFIQHFTPFYVSSHCEKPPSALFILPIGKANFLITPLLIHKTFQTFQIDIYYAQIRKSRGSNSPVSFR